MSDVTQILQQIESGDPSAAEKLLPLVGMLLGRRHSSLGQEPISEEASVPGDTAA